MYLPDEVKEEMQRNILIPVEEDRGPDRGLQGMVSGGKSASRFSLSCGRPNLL